VVNRPYPKLAYKCFGPYKVLERIGQAAYRLELPATNQVHNVFHVSQLKEFRPDYSPVFADLPNIPALDAMETEPEKVLGRRLVKKGNAALPRVLIKWKHLKIVQPGKIGTLKAKFPSVSSWGQATSFGGEPPTDGTP
jgi:hypothetical protein